MKRGKPVNVRPGRTTVVKLPSGEEVALESEQHKGHMLLRITAPEGSQIDHRLGSDESVYENNAVGRADDK